MTKVNVQQWSQLDFLINNFYEIVEYKRGRGIYGDRVILKRSKSSESIFGEPGRLYEFYYLDANAVKELPRTVYEKIKIITRFVTSPEDMNVLCDFEKSGNLEPSEWAVDTETALISSVNIDLSILVFLIPITTCNSSNSLAAFLIISKCPIVRGSKLPG